MVRQLQQLSGINLSAVACHSGGFTSCVAIRQTLSRPSFFNEQPGSYQRYCYSRRLYVSVYDAFHNCPRQQPDGMGCQRQPLHLAIAVFFATVLLLPIVIAYTIWVYRVLRGKVTVGRYSPPITIRE